MLDPLLWNKDNLDPSPDRPLLIIFRGLIPSLKNDRDIGVTKAGRKYSRPKAEVTQAIASIRDTLNRQLDSKWYPIANEVKMWMILGAHGVTKMPDCDLDNMAQTVQEALAAPRQKDKMTEAARSRLIMLDDRQVVSMHPLRRAFADKDRIYHELYIWASHSTVQPVEDIEEYSRVARLREEVLNAEAIPTT